MRSAVGYRRQLWLVFFLEIELLQLESRLARKRYVSELSSVCVACPPSMRKTWGAIGAGSLCGVLCSGVAECVEFTAMTRIVRYILGQCRGGTLFLCLESVCFC